MMRREELEKTLRKRESQTIEFKTSLAEQEDAIQTMAAFANAKGGKVFFGVKNDGTPVGVSLGENTLEKLANAIKEHTYPSLPVFIEDPLDYNGKTILIVESPKDVPPTVGVYLYSSEGILADRPVDANKLQAYRRVGRTNQKEDFMRLLQPKSSDPYIIILYRPSTTVVFIAGDAVDPTRGSFFPESQGFDYRNSGQGWAFKVTFQANHAVYKLQTPSGDISLPPPGQEVEPFQNLLRSSYVTVLNADQNLNNTQPAYLRATYEDDKGFTWQSVLELIPTNEGGQTPKYYFRPGSFRRRIIQFPPKNDPIEHD